MIKPLTVGFRFSMKTTVAGGHLVTRRELVERMYFAEAMKAALFEYRIGKVIDGRLSKRLPAIGIPYPPNTDALEYGPAQNRRWKIE